MSEDTQEVIFDELLQPFRPRLTRSQSTPDTRRLNAIGPCPLEPSEEADLLATAKKKKKSFSTEEALKLTEERREHSSQPNLLGFPHFYDSDKFPKGIIPSSILPAKRYE
mmetsp:Transcript_27284/g.41904  ORF Transcript_27284/g.41904 Transcript_27284/m.41904 type:complete len:110 (+) Transcript_27284:3-332(+)